MRGHSMTGDGIPAAFSFPQRGAIRLAADPNTCVRVCEGLGTPRAKQGNRKRKKGKKKKIEKKQGTSPSLEPVKRSRSQGRKAAGKDCITSTERGAQGGRAAVRAEPLRATAPQRRHFAYCYLQASLRFLCSSQGWVTRSRSLCVQIRPQIPKEKTKQGSGTEPRQHGLSQALPQQSQPSFHVPGGTVSLQIPPRGQLPWVTRGPSSAPRTAPHPWMAVPLRVPMPPRNLLYSFESIVLPRAPRLSTGLAASRSAGLAPPPLPFGHRSPAQRFLIRGLL